MTSERVMDEEDFLRRLGGDRALAGELASVLTATLPALEGRLAAAAAAGRGTDLSRAAHAIKGAVGTFSAPRAVAAARRLEMMGRMHPAHLPPETSRALCQELEEALAELVRYLGGRGNARS